MRPDLAAVLDAHARAEFVDRDVDATLATMVDEPYVTPRPGADRRRLGVRKSPALYRVSFIGRCRRGKCSSRPPTNGLIECVRSGV
jgi:hypothetical protein